MKNQLIAQSVLILIKFFVEVKEKTFYSDELGYKLRKCPI